MAITYSFSILRSFAPLIQYQTLILLNKLPLINIVKYNNNYLSTSSKNGPKYRLYTRTGDKGTSALYTRERRPKNDNIFEALGTTDELTSCIGLAREFIIDQVILNELEHIQCLIQDLQATIATPKSSANEFQIEKTKWNPDHLIELEKWIDDHTENLEPLKSFILPSGGKAASTLQLARAICRRAERRLVPLLDEGLELSVIQYINRLSSYLFTVARICSKIEGRKEVIYWERPNYKDKN